MKTMLNTPESDIFRDIGQNVDRLRKQIDQLVEGRRDLKKAQKAALEEYEREMLTFLWRCRTFLSTATMARMIGMSRQMLYEKWNHHGFDTTDIRS